MELICYRPPYPDELLYGWLQTIAELNYPLDPQGMQRIVDQVFPYGKLPEKRGIITKDPVRKDFVRGIDKGVRNLRSHGYRIESTERLITFSTPLVTIGVAQSAGNQARYIHTAVSEMSGGLLDMPSLPLLLSDVRYCPECMRENVYIRTWHNLPGVEVCAVHGIALQKLGRHDELTRGCDAYFKPQSCTDTASESRKKYAQYVKDIYDHPSIMHMQYLRKYLSCHKADSEDPNKCCVQSDPFTRLVNSLIGKEINYSAILSAAEANPAECMGKPFTLLSRTGPVGTFRCAVCGTVWTDAVKSAVIGLGCPECLQHRDPDETIAEILKGVGDGQYRLTEPFRGMGATQVIMHDMCGAGHAARMTNRIWNGTTCRCEIAHSTQSIQERVERKTTGFTVEEYTPTKEIVTLRHNTCGRSRIIPLISFMNNPTCDYCKKKEQDALRYNRLKEAIGDDYAIVNLPEKGLVSIMHTSCKLVITGNYKSFMKGPKCPLCVPYYMADRGTGNVTFESELYMEMQQWFIHHKLWVTRRHRVGEHTRQYYDALQVLEKKGLIFRVDSGSYSCSPNMSVYEILKWKYLINGEGETVGKFTGTTADYLTALQGDEPDVITLESGLLQRQSPCTVFVQGRRVIVRGIH